MLAGRIVGRVGQGVIAQRAWQDLAEIDGVPAVLIEVKPPRIAMTPDQVQPQRAAEIPPFLIGQARLAADAGCDGIIVSNHGGRQLDGALSSIRMLPSIVEAVGGKTEVWLDSGIRSGQDVLKAIALGASGTMIGRSFLYGLGAYGEDGVRRALELIRHELDISMAFGGYTDIRDVSEDILLKGTYEDLLTRPFIIRERV